jgi:hypothetical protein
MKKIKFILIIFAFIAFGCDKKLDLEPVGSIVETNFYKTQSDAIAAINACYNSILIMEGQGYYINPGYLIMGDIWSSDVQPHTDIVDYFQIQRYTLFPNNQSVEELWILGYEGILRANLALQKIPDIKMDETLKARLLGEAYFFRAFWYLRMVKFFGNVPLILEPLQVSQLYPPQVPKESTYAQIEKDFLEAEKVLPATYSGLDIGRATLGAAKVYLAELYMIQKEWAKARVKLEDINGLGIYGLVDNYSDLFTGKADNSKEGVFEIQFTAFTGLNIGNFNTVTSSPNGEGLTPNGGWGWQRPTQDIVDEFEVTPKEDPRLSASIFRKGDVFEGKVFEDQVHGTGYGERKFCISASMGSELSWPFQTSANVILYRYAEVCLMYAEVLNELGESATAVPWINKVRARPSVDMPPLSTTLTHDEVFEAIRHERRVELCFEQKTGYDLRRWGIAGSFLRSPQRWQNNITYNPQYDGAYFKFVDGQDEIFPIPQLEIDKSKGTLVQNPGYSSK